MKIKKVFDVYRNDEKVVTVNSFSQVLDFIFADFVKTEGKFEYSFKESEFKISEYQEYDIYRLIKAPEGFIKEFFSRRGHDGPNDVYSYIRCALRRDYVYFTNGKDEYWYHPASDKLFNNIDDLIYFDRFIFGNARGLVI